jgi:hypothetical protein
LIPRPGPTGQFWEAAEPLAKIYAANNGNDGEEKSNKESDDEDDFGGGNRSGEEENNENGKNDENSKSKSQQRQATSTKSSDKNFRSSVFSGLTQLVLRGKWAIMRLLPTCPLDAGDLSRLLAALTEEVPWFPADTNPLTGVAKNIAEIIPDRMLMTPSTTNTVVGNKNDFGGGGHANIHFDIEGAQTIDEASDFFDNNNNNQIGGHGSLNQSVFSNSNAKNNLSTSGGENNNNNNYNYNAINDCWSTPNVQQLSISHLLLNQKTCSSQFVLAWQFFCFDGPLKRYSACFASWTEIERKNMTNQYATSLRHVFNTAQDALKICEVCISLAAKMEKEIKKKNDNNNAKSGGRQTSTKFISEDDDQQHHSSVDYSLSAASYYTQQQIKQGKQSYVSALSIMSEQLSVGVSSSSKKPSSSMIGIIYSIQQERFCGNNNKSKTEENNSEEAEKKPQQQSKIIKTPNNNNTGLHHHLSPEIGGKIVSELVSNGLVDIALSVLSLVERWVAVMEASRNKNISDQQHQQKIRDEMKKMLRKTLQQRQQQANTTGGAEFLLSSLQEASPAASGILPNEEDESEEEDDNNPYQSKTIPWFQSESQRLFGLAVRLLSEAAEFSSDARKRILEHKIFSGSLQQLADRVLATNSLATKKLDEQINDRSTTFSMLPTTTSAATANGNYLRLLSTFNEHQEQQNNNPNASSTSTHPNSPNSINNKFSSSTGTVAFPQHQQQQNLFSPQMMADSVMNGFNFSTYEGASTLNHPNQKRAANAADREEHDALENTAVLQFLQVRRGYSSGLTGHSLQRALNSGGMLDRLKLLCEVAPHLANIASSIHQTQQEHHHVSQQLQQQQRPHSTLEQVSFYQTPFFANAVFAVCCLVLHGLPILNPEDPLQDAPLLLQAHEALESVLKGLIALTPDPATVQRIKANKKKLHSLNSTNTSQSNSASIGLLNATSGGPTTTTTTMKKPTKNPEMEEIDMLQSRTTMSLIPIFKLRLLKFQPWYKDLQILATQLIWKALQTDPDAALCNVETFPHPQDDSHEAEQLRSKRVSMKNFQKHVKLVHRMKKMEADRTEQAVLIERCMVQFIELVDRENSSRELVHRRDAAARRRYMFLNEQRAQLDRYLSVDRRGEYLHSEYDEFCAIERLAMENIERIDRAKNVLPFEALDRTLMAQIRDFFLYEYQFRIQHVYGPESVAWNATKREMMIGLAVVRKHYGKMCDMQQLEFNKRTEMIAQQKTRFEKNIAPLWARAVIEATETRTRRIEIEEKWLEGFGKVRREYFNNSLRVFQRYESHCRNQVSLQFSNSLKRELDSRFELLGCEAEENSDRNVVIKLFNTVFVEIAQGWLQIRADWLSVCEKAAREHILIEASEATYGPKHWILPTLRCAGIESQHRMALAASEAKERAAFTRAWVWAMQLAVLDEERAVRRNLMIQWAWQVNSIAFARNRGLFEAEETLRRRLEERGYHDDLCLIRSAARTSAEMLKGQLQVIVEHQQGASAIISEEGWLRTGLITLVKERILALKKILREYEKVAAITAKILAEGGEIIPQTNTNPTAVASSSANNNKDSSTKSNNTASATTNSAEQNNNNNNSNAVPGRTTSRDRSNTAASSGRTAVVKSPRPGATTTITKEKENAGDAANNNSTSANLPAMAADGLKPKTAATTSSTSTSTSAIKKNLTPIASTSATAKKTTPTTTATSAKKTSATNATKSITTLAAPSSTTTSPPVSAK